MVVNTVKNTKQGDVLKNFTDPKLHVTFRSKFHVRYIFSKNNDIGIHQKEV